MARTNYEMNKQKTKVPMPELDPIERAQTFDEVASGYSEEDAVAEARRCIQCPKAPCVSGCPVGVPIPQFIAQVAEGNFAQAYAIVKGANALPAICGRVCPQETQCEGVCTRGRGGEPVGIGRLERFVADWAFAHPEEATAALASASASASSTCETASGANDAQSLKQSSQSCGTRLVDAVDPACSKEGSEDINPSDRSADDINRSEPSADGTNPADRSADDANPPCHPERSAEGAESKDLSGKRVAVVGSGPASLTCAGELAKLGCDVTVFEALHKVGGVLTYGIPEFRLPKDLVEREVAALGESGVSFEVNALVGKLYDIDELMEERGFDAVFVGTGAGLPTYLGIEGEGLNGVSVANELLTRVNLMKAYLFPEYDTPVYAGKKCVVVGGGNVAMDAARTAKRLGADVTVVYRRGREEMPARAEEIHHAEQEGIAFQLLTNPVRILGNDDGWVNGLECVRMELGEPDASGRRRPVAVEGSEFVIDIDMLVIAVGSKTNPLVAQTTPGLEVTPRNLIVADERTCATSKPGVFAGGDAVIGAATVILAMGAGKRAAAGITEYLTKR